MAQSAPQPLRVTHLSRSDRWVLLAGEYYSPPIRNEYHTVISVYNDIILC
jgi:hypothetical protein